tara:strand:+ start:686 stop:2272 length:1587 start_codon:yes stop_codon:yes gene_type:complete
MRTIFILSFLLFGVLGNAQLIDPFGKVKTHEIKLTKLNDGSFMGAMEWTSGGIDSLQRFVVKGLSVKAPVLVRIISKAPKHNIDISFHKSGWDKIESKVSTGEDKFVDKIFRTMNMAGIGVSSKVGGIPYVIIIKVGLQFPSTKSLIRITDDIEEYNLHLQKLGIAGSISSATIENNTSAVSATRRNRGTVMYIIIGLLSLIIVLLVLFLLLKKNSKHTLFIFITLISINNLMAQNEPKLVPVDGQGASPVFYEYGTSNVANQTPVPKNTAMTSGKAQLTNYRNNGSTDTRAIQIDHNSGATVLNGEESAVVMTRIKEANEAFDREYNEDMPGEPTEGGQRVPPPDFNGEQLEQLSRQVQQLKSQVELLSEEDEDFDDDWDDNDGGFNENQIVIYCEELNSCRNCHHGLMANIARTEAYFRFLQDFYSSEIKELKRLIHYGNAGSQVHAATAIAWQGTLHNKIEPAMNQLRKAYSDKFDDYIESMINDFEAMDAKCNPMNSTRGGSTSLLKQQASRIVEHYRRAKIME